MCQDGVRSLADLLRSAKMKRAQGISINVIVLTAIALIVMVVLVVIFLGRGHTFQQGLGQCKGTCVPRGTPCPTETASVPTPNCDDGVTQPIQDGTCCIKI